jgi:ABC-2 type transport system permease protein
MWRIARLYLRLIAAQIRSQMQYRASFVTEIIGSFLITILDFITVVILLNRFQSIGGWTLAEVALLYGTSAISFSLAELFTGDFDRFDTLVVHGDFDRVLIRPLGVVFQMMTGAFPLRRLGRMAQGVLGLAVALYLLKPAWQPAQWAFLAVVMAGGALFFAAVIILGATMAFWTPQTAELTNTFTYGGTFMTSYPMHIYEKWMRAIFTFVIPMAFINYYPALYLLGKPDPFGLPAWMPFLSPVVAIAVMVLALLLWRFGVGRYQSTGS